MAKSTIREEKEVFHKIKSKFQYGKGTLNE
jgi:hypothetical protein